MRPARRGIGRVAASANRRRQHRPSKFGEPQPCGEHHGGLFPLTEASRLRYGSDSPSRDRSRQRTIPSGAERSGLRTRLLRNRRSRGGRPEDFTRDQHTYDVVLDAVGKSTFGRCKRLLKPEGIYLSSELGPPCQNPILALATPLLGGRRVLFPIPKHDQAMVTYFRELIESGAFKPVVDRQIHWPRSSMPTGT